MRSGSQYAEYHRDIVMLDNCLCGDVVVATVNFNYWGW